MRWQESSVFLLQLNSIVSFSQSTDENYFSVCCFNKLVRGFMTMSTAREKIEIESSVSCFSYLFYDRYSNPYPCDLGARV